MANMIQMMLMGQRCLRGTDRALLAIWTERETAKKPTRTKANTPRLVLRLTKLFCGGIFKLRNKVLGAFSCLSYLVEFGPVAGVMFVSLVVRKLHFPLFPEDDPEQDEVEDEAGDPDVKDGLEAS